MISLNLMHMQTLRNKTYKLCLKFRQKSFIEVKCKKTLDEMKMCLWSHRLFILSLHLFY